MYAKLIDGKIVFAPRKMVAGDYVIYNPTEETLTAEGYKPVVYTDPPGEADPGYMWAEKWYELSDSIYQAWKQIPAPIGDENSLVRYSNELTGEQDETLIEATETLIKLVKEEMDV